MPSLRSWHTPFSGELEVPKNPGPDARSNRMKNIFRKPNLRS
ncbi:hypothetical protein LEP1GSC061_0374 [Leptospira wolffii serovar Khorat str. Khorat-H2]|nr:hypothetical protein LEP1GSC061_0374 [Leptospira wolffii serovar Khorat str. Khorat-H2]